jgi:Zn-dependent alcohol dehydrogenase
VRRAYQSLADGRLGAGRIINARRRLADIAEVFELLERGTVLKCAVIP